MILRTLCIAILAGLLIVGLWPFHHPGNQVTWIHGADGLQYGAAGTVLGSSPLKISAPPGSLEVWLKPEVIPDTNTIVAFSSPAVPIEFSLRQQVADLQMRHYEGAWQNARTAAHVDLDRFFQRDKSVFITVTSGADGTELYADGELKRTFPQFRLFTRNLEGELVVGDSPVDHDSWSGELRGLAIYRTELTASQVRRHYETWTRSASPQIAEEEQPVALYLFNEREGNVVHNHAGPASDLYIPVKYQLVHPAFLESPQSAFRPGWDYWEDVLINVGGFVPMGFCFRMYFASALPSTRATLATLAAGAVISLVIEMLQTFIPTRHSDMTDVLTNIVGTCVGIMLYHSGLIRSMALRVIGPASLIHATE